MSTVQYGPYSFRSFEKLGDPCFRWVVLVEGSLSLGLSLEVSKRKEKMERGYENNKPPKQWKVMVMLLARAKYFSPFTFTTNSSHPQTPRAAGDFIFVEIIVLPCHLVIYKQHKSS